MEELTGPALSELKKLFAAGLAQGLEPFVAMCNAVPGHMSITYSNLSNRADLAKRWEQDPEVLAFLSVDEGGLSRDALARELWLSIQRTKDPAGKAKLARELSAIMGWVEAPGKKAGPEVVPGVMLVQAHGSDEDWEKAAQSQQSALAKAGTAKEVRH